MANNDIKNKPYPLFLRFSLLSIATFFLVGYFIILGIRPALKNFIIASNELHTVIALNRIAQEFLTKESLQFPLSPEQEATMANFIRNIYIPAAMAIIITDEHGLVVYAEPREFSDQFIGSNLAPNFYVSHVIVKQSAIADFVVLGPQEKTFLSVDEAFVQAVPITFGKSVQLAGVVYSISRTGFIIKAIGNIQQSLTLRIVVAFLLLYLTLAFIVGGASRVISKQTADLRLFAQRQIFQANELSRLKDQFVFIAAHELRSPVTSISLALELLTKFEKSLAPATNELLRDINNATIRLKNLINDLLDASRLESGKFSISNESVDLVKLIKNNFDDLESLAEEQKIKTFLELDKNLPQKIVTDPNKLREVLTNLITNAVKYNRLEGTVNVSASFDLKAKEVVFKVKDTGLGISEGDQKRVFERFWRSDDVRKTEGTGLGLWISKQIVERLGGRIGFESKIGAGSTFYFVLPIQPPAPEHSKKEKPT